MTALLLCKIKPCRREDSDNASSSLRLGKRKSAGGWYLLIHILLHLTEPDGNKWHNYEEEEEVGIGILMPSHRALCSLQQVWGDRVVNKCLLGYPDRADCHIRPPPSNTSTLSKLLIVAFIYSTSSYLSSASSAAALSSPFLILSLFTLLSLCLLDPIAGAALGGSFLMMMLLDATLVRVRHNLPGTRMLLATRRA